MHLVAFVVGAAIVVTVFWDAFETLVLPRTPRRRLRLTRLFYRATWTWWMACARRVRSNDQRERFLALYGPASVFVVLTCWILALVVGYALLQWSQRDHLANVHGAPTFTDDLYVSATALFALGLSNVAPNGRAGRLLIVAETGSSLLLLSMLFSYIAIVYQSFARREVRITMLDAWAGSPPSATEILSRTAAAGSLSQLDTFFADWEYWCSDVLESHLSYPAIGYFRSQHPRQSWVSALATLLDVATLVKVGIEGVPSWRAHLMFAVARHAAVDLAHVLGTPPRQLSDRLPAHALGQVRSELERTGLRPDRSRAADEELIELRASYEPYVAALASRLMVPLPSWHAVSRNPDNWQTDHQITGEAAAPLKAAVHPIPSRDTGIKTDRARWH